MRRNANRDWGRLIAALVVVTVAGLAACHSPPTRGPFPELSYSHLPPFRLDVAQIEIVDVYQSPGTDPNVEHLFPVSPAAAAHRWADDRLEAVGIDGVARFIILDASAIEQRNAPPPAGSSSTKRRDRYDMRISVRLEISKAGGALQAFVTAETTLVQTVDPATTLNERERFWFRNVETMMESLNAELDRAIPAEFAPYLR